MEIPYGTFNLYLLLYKQVQNKTRDENGSQVLRQAYLSLPSLPWGEDFTGNQTQPDTCWNCSYVTLVCNDHSYLNIRIEMLSSLTFSSDVNRTLRIRAGSEHRM